MNFFNFLFFVLFVTLSECHNYYENNNHGDRRRPGYSVKSYGGYFPDTGRQNEPTNDFANVQDYHRQSIASYQPYGWNFNQPTRTYGGINALNHRAPNNNHENPQHGPDNRIGWANSNNYGRLNPSPYFPPLPQQNIFFPNFPPFVPQMFPYGYNYPNNFPNYPSYGTNYPHQRPIEEDNINNQGIPNNAQPNHGQLPYPQSNMNQGFLMPYPNQAQIPNPQNNVNQGIPTGNNNRNIGGTSNFQPGQVQPTYPQNNVFQGIPDGNINRRPGGVNTLRPEQGQIPLQTGSNNRNIGGSTNIQANQGRFPTSQNGLNQGNLGSNINENDGEVGFQFPLSPDLHNQNEIDATSGIDIRNYKNKNSTSGSGSNNENDFASNSFFENNDKRHWTNDDEAKWLATTKAPYFENKVPGLECTLPAAAVLGAENAFKFSTLLPLLVPIGKPILSCNATDLRQSQIKLDGKIYDCFNSDMTIACPTHEGTVDKCEGQILQCDTGNIENIWCTNGTLISNSDIECRNALVETNKSTLNCFFKNSKDIETTTHTPFVSVLPVISIPSSDDSSEVNFDSRKTEDDNDYEDNEDVQDLIPQVQIAMKNIFPSDLLTMPSTGYLPPRASMQPIDQNLRNHINGIFNADMLATSINNNRNIEGKSNTPSSTENVFNSRNQQGWNVNLNTNTGGSSGTKRTAATIENRVNAPNNQQQNDRRDRLIFTD